MKQSALEFVLSARGYKRHLLAIAKSWDGDPEGETIALDALVLAQEIESVCEKLEECESNLTYRPRVMLDRAAITRAREEWK